jgi:hypothetical protein
MRKSTWLALAISLSFLVFQTTSANEQKPDDQTWTADFPLEKDELSTIGRNPHFILEPGYVLVLEKGSERVTITVLNMTKVVAEVETRVVEEKETKGGKLVEISRNYYAISKRIITSIILAKTWICTRAIVGHGGAWMSGIDGKVRTNGGVIRVGSSITGFHPQSLWIGLRLLARTRPS